MTIKLSDTQLIILSTACQRDNRLVQPLPRSPMGGAVQKVIASLINKGLVQEVEAGPGQPHWRSVNGIGITLVATDAAFEAVGIELPGEPAQPAHEDIETAEQSSSAKSGAADAAAPARRTRPNTKQSQLIAMLEKGATADEIAIAFAWQKHTVRGAIAGALKKRLGLTITSEKAEGRGRVYKINRA